MDCPVMDYISNNYYQQKEANDVIRKFVEKMTWKTDEVVLDLGCGPGDVSSNILYPLIKNKIKQLVCVDKLHKFIEYAKISYENSHINFKILDIENANECSLYAHTFDKIFSFLCFHWVWNKMNALVNMKSMLRNNGEICIHYLLNVPNVEIYKKLDPEWQIYTKKTMQANMPVYSLEETKTIFEKAGFRVVSIETNKNKFTFQNIASIISTFKCADEMYQYIPPKDHERYALQFEYFLSKSEMVELCPTTGKATFTFNLITVHAVKENI
ncbi:juvenile hormone acid O-methyltransferase-like [Sipha flava]|uniref:Juvenile hormone acid O-methyltransferase-like n=1 Tax=Sipha flava TaxID=143950 RepID=A0A8B8F9W5_9HEMI|nr:juvenile hormone acid O-methyltransferase-like [Sipha flava]